MRLKGPGVFLINLCISQLAAFGRELTSLRPSAYAGLRFSRRKRGKSGEIRSGRSNLDRADFFGLDEVYFSGEMGNGEESAFVSSL